MVDKPDLEGQALGTSQTLSTGEAEGPPSSTNVSSQVPILKTTPFCFSKITMREYLTNYVGRCVYNKNTIASKILMTTIIVAQAEQKQIQSTI